MLDQVADILQKVTLIQWLVLVFLLFSGLIAIQWEKVKFFWLRFWCDFPVVGKIATLGREAARDGSGAWYQSENELCSAFYDFYPHHASPADFEKATIYLRRSCELGRRNFPKIGWVMVFVLLVAEAASFGVLIAGAVAQNATLSQQKYLGYLLAAVLAIALLFFTHAAGREAYTNILRSKVRHWFQSRPRDEADVTAIHPNLDVSLDKPIDDDEPNYLQLANRLDGGQNETYLPSRKVTIVTMVFVILIAGAAFAVREYVREQLEIAEVTSDMTIGGTAAPGGSGISAIDQMNQGAESRAAEEGQRAARNAALASFGMLSLLFLAVQGIGAAVGFKYGFVGKESAEAARIRGRFATVDEFILDAKRRRDRVVRIAQAKLSRLQGRIRNSGGGDPDGVMQSRTFLRWVQEQEMRIQGSSDSVASAGAPGASSPDQDAALRAEIEREIRQRKLAAERESRIRAEVEAEVRRRLGQEGA